MQRFDINPGALKHLDYNVVTPNITSTNIKKELVESDEERDENVKSKCGEIFAYYNGHFVLVCGFCDQEFDEMSLFGEHVRVNHICDAAIQQDGTEVVRSLPRTKTETLYLQGGGTPNMGYDATTAEGVVDKQFSKPPDFHTSSIQYSQQFKQKNCLKRRHLQSESSLEDSREFSTTTKRQKAQSVLSSGDSQEYSNDQDLDIKDIWIENEQELVQNYPTRFSKIGTHSADISGSDTDNDTDESHNGNENQDLDNRFSTAEKLYSCDLCNRKYKSKKSLNRHRQKPHQPNDSIKSEKSDLFRENNEQDPDRTTKGSSSDEAAADGDASLHHCDICNKYFKTKYSLNIHSDIHDVLPSSLQDDQSFLRCKFCNKQFNKFAERKTHEIIHVGNRPYECPHCNKRFPTNYDRKLHIRTHTGENPYVCSHCPKVCTNGTDLKRHIDRHLNIRKFGCELCEKRFYRPFELARHMRTHTKERPYVCEDCGATYPVLAQLKDHQLRHTGVKNVKCEICGRLFYSKSVLKVHMPTHFDEKPFTCDVCGRKFSRAKAMQKHMKLHSGIKPYVCNICGKAYAQDSGLYAHKKSHVASKI